MAEIDSDNQKMQQNNVKKLVEDVLAYGDIVLIANKGMGKTNTLRVLAKHFRALPDTRVIIFEDLPKWCKEFDGIPFMLINDDDVVQTNHTIDMENYFLRHERDYTVRRGKEIALALKECKHLLFLSGIQDIERQAFFIYSIVNHFYRKHWLRDYKGYKKHERIVFIIEESQNVFDNTIIGKKLFNRLRKIFSGARNLGIHFVLASQRLQDLNTKIRNRARLMIGRVSQDDYELKIDRLLKHSNYRHDILNFKRGEFLYLPTDTKIQFPKFEQEGTPHQLKFRIKHVPRQAPKPPFWKRLLGLHNAPTPFEMHKKPNRSIKFEIVNNEESEEDESTELNAIMAETDREDEEYFW